MNKLRSLILALLAMATCSGGFPVPDYHAVDNNGDPCNGCRLYTYVVGTTTDKATYSDDALTALNSNPIDADSAGRFGRIYLLEDECYKFVLKASAVDGGSTYYTIDDVCGDTLTNAAIATRITQIASNPIDQGAAGDGTTDDTTEVQAAIDAATGVVDLVGKTYRVSSALTLPSNIIFRNGTLDFSQDASGELHILGTIASTATLDNNAAKGATQIDVAQASIGDMSVGDVLFVTSSDQYNSLTNVGELVEIETVNAGTVDITTELKAAYNTGDGATTQILTVKENVILEDLRITSSTTTGGDAIKIQYARNVTLRNVRVEDIESTAIRISASKEVWLDGAYINNGKISNSVGVAVEWGSRNIWLRNMKISNVEYGYTLSKWYGGGLEGVVTNVFVENSDITNFFTTAIYMDGAQEYTIRGNTIDAGASTGVAAAIQTSDGDFIIEGNRITGFDGDGIRLTYDGDLGYRYGYVNNNIIDGSSTDGSDDALIEWTTNASGAVETIQIKNNELINAYATAIDVQLGSEAVKSVSIAGNVIDVDSTAAGTAILVDGDIDLLSVHDNEIEAAGVTTAIDAGDANGEVSIRGNNIELVSGGKGLSLTVASATQAKPLLVQGNIIDDTAGTATGIEIDYSNAAGIALVDIASNLAYNCNNPFEMRGYAGHVNFHGNMLTRDDDAAVNVTFNGDAPGSLDHISIDSNMLSEGTYGISLNNTGTVEIGHNAFHDMATGNLTGDTPAAQTFLSSIAAPNLTTVETTLTNSEVINLAATPITIVANAAGKIHEFVSAVCQMNYGGTNVWAAGAGDDFDFRWVDNSGLLLSEELETTAWLTAAADSYHVVTALEVTGGITTAQGVNVPIVIGNNGSEITGNAGLDNTVTCWTTYRTHTVK